MKTNNILFYFVATFPDIHMWCVFCPKLEGQSFAAARQHDVRISAPTHRVVDPNLAARLILQKRQRCHLPNYDHSKPLHMVVERQNHLVHGQVSWLIPCFLYRNTWRLYDGPSWPRRAFSVHILHIIERIHLIYIEENLLYFTWS